MLVFDDELLPFDYGIFKLYETLLGELTPSFNVFFPDPFCLLEPLCTIPPLYRT